MKTENLVAQECKTSELQDHYSQAYLKQYWPEFPESAVGWADNAVLMLAYQEAALAVQQHFNGRPVKMLDISTGPALAPLLAMITCVSEVQLSDFNPDNRTCLQNMPIEYWRNYVPMLVKLFDHPEQQVSEILQKLDQLRSEHLPIEIDLFHEQLFYPCVNYEEYSLISMQFVADSITKNSQEYFQCLGQVTNIVSPNATLIMSAIVDCTGWQLDDNKEASPNISEKEILDFLKDQGFKILNLSRSMRFSELSYDGGWIVLAATKLINKQI